MSEYNIQMNKYNALNAEYDQLYPATKIANVDGLDTALQKKAPAGYGWGDANNYTFYTNDEFKEWFMQNAAPKCFRNTFAASVYIGDIYNYRMLIIASGDYSTSGIVILGYTYNGHELRATINDYGIWGPWEWVNPPMEPGKEYRTTERYLGKPVYAQLFSIGACAAGSSVNLYKRVGTLNTDKIVSYCGYAANCALPYFVRDATYNIMVAVQKVEGKFDLGIGLTTGTSVSFAESYVAVKYTKTTD